MWRELNQWTDLLAECGQVIRSSVHPLPSIKSDDRPPCAKLLNVVGVRGTLTLLDIARIEKSWRAGGLLSGQCP